jgi:copper chaperone NosL
MKIALAAASAALLLALGGCEAEAGPGEVKLGRDACENCGMIISDPRYVSELRLADGKLHKFDDVGDAVEWLAKHCVQPADAKEFWVMDSANGKTWLDGRSAFYRPAETPMNFGWGAVAASGPDTLAFEAMRERVLRAHPSCK